MPQFIPESTTQTIIKELLPIFTGAAMTGRLNLALEPPFNLAIFAPAVNKMMGSLQQYLMNDYLATMHVLASRLNMDVAAATKLYEKLYGSDPIVDRNNQPLTPENVAIRLGVNIEKATTLLDQTPNSPIKKLLMLCERYNVIGITLAAVGSLYISHRIDPDGLDEIAVSAIAFTIAKTTERFLLPGFKSCSRSVFQFFNQPVTKESYADLDDQQKNKPFTPV